jgi:hypothetical protein
MMKLRLLKYKTKSTLKRSRALRKNLPYGQGVDAGIIFTVEDKPKHDLIKDLIKKLEHDGKKVRVICFLPRKKENYEFLFDFFTEEDLSFWGNINSSSASSFCNTPFDFLFYVDINPNPLILNLIARSEAKCRLGIYSEENEPYFEMMIENVDNVKSLADSMYKYVRLLK